MAAEREGRVVFLFDENMPHRLARALREELGENAYHVYDVLHPRAPDEMVLRYAGERGWCVVGRDHMILRRAHERAVLARYGIGAFFLKPSLDDFCKVVRAVVRHWPEMKRIARAEEKHFLYLVRKTSVVPLRKKGLG